jgi:hypothetical protein
MEEVSIFDTSVNFSHATRRNILEDSHLHTRRRENLKSHLTPWSIVLLKKSVVTQLYKKVPPLVEPLTLLSCSQEPATGPYPE